MTGPSFTERVVDKFLVVLIWALMLMVPLAVVSAVIRGCR